MAKIQIQATIEGYIDKYKAYEALCTEIGLQMLTDGTANRYTVEEGILYQLVDKSYHGSPQIEKEIYSKDFQTVMLFESLLNVKHYL